MREVEAEKRKGEKLGTSVRNSSPVTSDLILNIVGLAIGSVDGTDVAVVGNVLQVTTVLQPRTSHTDACEEDKYESNWERERNSLDVLSVVHLPWALMRIGASMISLPSHGSERKLGSRNQQKMKRIEGKIRKRRSKKPKINWEKA